MRPGISFVCTVYNKEAYLPGVLAALRDQAPDRPRQFIFVDDGSRDASMRIVREHTAG
jgi:glycosyltransferase involved in cell wall biosynthesis